MKYHKQLSPHLPTAGLIGDCFRTCLACLLDKDSPADVPHFYQMAFERDGFHTQEDHETKAHIFSWLASQGLQLMRIPFVGNLYDITLQVEAMNPRILYMVQGKSSDGEHVVIYKGADMLWDPSPTNSGILEMGADGVYWIIFLVPISQRWDGCLPSNV